VDYFPGNYEEIIYTSGAVPLFLTAAAALKEAKVPSRNTKSLAHNVENVSSVFLAGDQMRIFNG